MRVFGAFDVWMVLLFGLVGYVFLKAGCKGAPLHLGFILGPLMEEHLRRALRLSDSQWWSFFERPVSASPPTC